MARRAQQLLAISLDWKGWAMLGCWIPVTEMWLGPSSWVTYWVPNGSVLQLCIQGTALATSFLAGY